MHVSLESVAPVENFTGSTSEETSPTPTTQVHQRGTAPPDRSAPPPGRAPREERGQGMRVGYLMYVPARPGRSGLHSDRAASAHLGVPASRAAYGAYVTAAEMVSALWILQMQAPHRGLGPTRTDSREPPHALPAYVVGFTRHRSGHPRPLPRPARRRRRSTTPASPAAATDHTARPHPRRRPSPPDSDGTPGTPRGGGPSRPLVPPHPTRRAPPEAPPPAGQP